MTSLSNIRIFILIFLFSVFIFISFFLFFQADPQELFICDIYLEQKISIGNSEYSFLYPHSRCDDEIYLDSIKSFESIFSESNNQYQNRPLYLISNYLSYKFFDMFLSSTNSIYEFLPELSFFITQILYFSIGVHLLVKVLVKYYEVSIYNLMLVTFIAALNPLLQFGIFTPSNQTISTLVFIVSVYLLEKQDLRKNLFTISIFLGLLFLLNRSFFIAIITVNLYSLFKNKLSVRNLINNFISIIIFLYQTSYTSSI